MFQPLWSAARYKGAKGGRGSGKSHNYAEMLIVRCLTNPGTRWACVREIQKSLEQSVKRLLEDKIKKMGVSHYFKIMDDRIKTPGGGIIIFIGMQNHTADSIKSIEGFHGVWFEEAHKASEYSLGLLRPTFRQGDSEMWFSWNPYSAKDPIERLFNPKDMPPRSVMVTANFYDNHRFPEVLRLEMEYDKRRDPDRYKHVWLGNYQVQSGARVFKRIKIDVFDIPEGVRFYQGCDWGFSQDPTVLVQCFIQDRTIFFTRERWKIGLEIDDTPAFFAGTDPRTLIDPKIKPRWENKRGYEGITDVLKWPIIADSSDPQNISYMRRHGFENMKPSIKGVNSVEQGIEFLRSYDIVIHELNCPRTADEFINYSYKIDKHTEEILSVLQDDENHTIDSARYSVEPLRRVTGQTVFATYGSG